jgi:hypothetical protein
MIGSLTLHAMIACRLIGPPLGVDELTEGTADAPDCAPALQGALDGCAEAGGGVVELASGRFPMRGPLTIPAGVTLRGQWAGPHYSSLDRGTVLEVYWGEGQTDGPPQFMLGESSTLQGVTVFYPEQDVNDIQPYPWTVQGQGTHLNVIDCTFSNPYWCIDFGTYGHEMHYVRNVYGCPLNIGVSLDQCTDIGRVENVHFNPNAWTRCGAPNAPTGEGIGTLMRHLQANLVAFEIGRSDWEMMINTFSYGANIGYRFYNSSRGITGATNGDFLGIAADWAVTAVLVEETQPAGLLITNGQFVGSPASEAVFEISQAHTGVVQLTNCAFWGPHRRVIRNTGPGQVSLNQCNFVQWDIPGEGVPAVEFSAGTLSMQSCIFRGIGTHLLLSEECGGATLMGCQTRGPLNVESPEGVPLELLGNLVLGG